MDIAQAIPRIRKLFLSQRLAVLATQGEKGPYCNLVAFAPSEDLKFIYFATTRSTRKFDNLSHQNRVSLLMDNRRNIPADLHQAVAVTALGRASECRGAEREKGLDLFLKRHPYLSDFADSPSGTLLKVYVETYLLVSSFQNVLEVNVDETAHTDSL